MMRCNFSNLSKFLFYEKAETNVDRFSAQVFRSDSEFPRFWVAWSAAISVESSCVRMGAVDLGGRRAILYRPFAAFFYL